MRVAIHDIDVTYVPIAIAPLRVIVRVVAVRRGFVIVLVMVPLVAITSLVAFHVARSNRNHERDAAFAAARRIQFAGAGDQSATGSALSCDLAGALGCFYLPRSDRVLAEMHTAFAAAGLPGEGSCSTRPTATNSGRPFTECLLTETAHGWHTTLYFSNRLPAVRPGSKVASDIEWYGELLVTSHPLD